MRKLRHVPALLVVVTSVVVVACSSTGASSTRVGGCGADAGGRATDNGSIGRAVDLGGTLTDDPGSSRTLPWTPGSSTDEDWFRVAVNDTGFAGDPVVTVTATDGIVTTWFACNENAIEAATCDGTNEPAPTFSETELRDATGCGAPSGRNRVESSTDCADTSEDDGILWIRVTRRSCDPYTLTVNVR